MSRASRYVRPDAAAAAFLFAVYCATLARGVTYWDAGEFLAAIHSLGIPHPPGTPLFILLGRVWSFVFAPLVGFTVAVNAFSAFCTAVAFGVVANLFWRWTSNATGAFCAAITGGLMSTVWLNATETEVYACSLLASVILPWCASRAALDAEKRWLLLTVYLCGLAWSLHLTALLAVPAAAVLLWPRRQRFLVTGNVIAGLGLLLLGGSVVLFMLLRAMHDPVINQGSPSTLGALVDAVQRHQYDVAPMWPRRAPLWLQLGNIFEYADWQVALGLAPGPPPSLLRTPWTIFYGALGIYGSVRHRRADVTSWRAWMMLLVSTSIGIALYLNMRAGASYGYGVLPPGALHEARDRDYFFTWAFVAWGAWAGFGAEGIARAVMHSVAHTRSAGNGRGAIALATAILVAALPCALNWNAIVAERRDNNAAATRARTILQSVPPGGVFLAVGDNDTYPVWYMQEVQSLRRDVIMVTVPLLPPHWYREELSRRHQLLDSSFVNYWRGIPATVADVRARATAQGRTVVQSPLP